MMSIQVGRGSPTVVPKPSDGSGALAWLVRHELGV